MEDDMKINFTKVPLQGLTVVSVCGDESAAYFSR
jgi:hypothetical protein